MTTKMLSYHNDKKVKLKYVNRMKAHIKADELIKGSTGDGGKGCAVWCTLDRYDHAGFQEELGMPEWLARLYDALFERQTSDDSKVFALEFLKAVPVGVDLNPVKWKFCSFVLKENIDRVLALTLDEKLKEQVVSAIRGSLALHESAVLTGVWDESAAWSAARSAESAARSAESAAWSAESAAWSAAWSAARSAESAARSAAWSAERSAESAAWSAESAGRSAAWSAESAADKRYADELLRLIKECK